MTVSTNNICLADMRCPQAIIERVAKEIIQAIEPIVGVKLAIEWVKSGDLDNEIGSFRITKEP